MNIEDQEETTYDKGRSLELEFSVFMKRELNWEKVRVGAHMAGKTNSKGAAIDVVGERLDKRGKNFHSFATIWIIGAGILFILALIWAFESFDNSGIGFLVVALAFMASAIFFMIQSDIYNKENAWVECKNLKGKVNINQVDKSIREFKDYKNSGNKEYKFEEHYFVSSSGFVENALKYAIENNIKCYVKDGATFKHIGYWH